MIFHMAVAALLQIHDSCSMQERKGDKIGILMKTFQEYSNKHLRFFKDFPFFFSFKLGYPITCNLLNDEINYSNMIQCATVFFFPRHEYNFDYYTCNMLATQQSLEAKVSVKL